MSKTFVITTRDLDNKYVVEKSITIKLPQEKLKEIKEIAIEVDDVTYEILNCIVENDLLGKMDDENFRQLVMDAYYAPMFEFED